MWAAFLEKIFIFRSTELQTVDLQQIAFQNTMVLKGYLPKKKLQITPNAFPR